MSRLSTCTTDCTDTKHSSVCRKRQSRAGMCDTSVTANQPSVTNPVTKELSRVTNASVTVTGVTRCDPMAVPGDPGYYGVCFEIGGVWQVRPGTAKSVIDCTPHILTKHDLANWRGSLPYYLDQDTGLANMDDDTLLRTLASMNQWQGTKHYAERVYRLVHGLTDRAIPANMIADGYKVAV